MRIHTVWATRTYSPDEPELLVAWDEFSIDAHPEGFEEEVTRALGSLGSDLGVHRRIVISVPDRDITTAFLPDEVEGVVQ
jgi:hypothetical protein